MKRRGFMSPTTNHSFIAYELVDGSIIWAVVFDHKIQFQGIVAHEAWPETVSLLNKALQAFHYKVDCKQLRN